MGVGWVRLGELGWESRELIGVGEVGVGGVRVVGVGVERVGVR